MLLKSVIISELTAIITLSKMELQSKSKLGLTDDNRYWENIIKVVLNRCYGYNLKNLNEEQMNFPGIDLGDYEKGIGFQITVTKKGMKIKDTLDEILNNKVYIRFPTIKVFILGEKQKKYSIVLNEYQRFFSFTADDILDFNDLLDKFNSMEIDDLVPILDYLRNEIQVITKWKRGIDQKRIDFKYLHELVGTSLENLKGRFSRDFNVDVELSNWLNKFCNTNFNKEKLCKVLCEERKAISQNKIVDNSILVQQFDQVLEKINNDEAVEYDFIKEEIENFIAQTETAIREKYKSSEKDYYQSNEYYLLKRLCNADYGLDEFREAMLASVFIITGEAGVGKSHSIAQFVYNNYFISCKPCIFLLGQHLNDNVNPVSMIERYLHLPYTLQSFLEELNTFGESNNVEIPFIIEGINEGLYSQIWKEYFCGLVSIFINYKRIKLIISIRNTYIKKCLPEGYNKNDYTLVIEHKGFENNTLDAITAFFEYYSISMPTFPILYIDFYNPLFLHTLCKTIQGTKNIVINEYSSFTEVFRNYLKVLERIISEKCKYIEKLKLVQKVVDNVIKYSLAQNMIYSIEIDIFYKIVGETVTPFGVNLNDFVQAMIDSGLFYTELYGYEEDDEYIEFSYERYHNIIAAHYILGDIKNENELKESIINGGIGHCFAKQYNGIIEELFVQIPQKFNTELLCLLPDETAKKVLNPFLSSLIWRKGSEINFKQTKFLINKYIIVYDTYFEKLLKHFLIIAPIKNHPFNALALHDYLMMLNMADRDSFWIKCVIDDVRYGGILSNLLKLSKIQKNIYSKDTKYLILLLLSWTLACTQNDYREKAIRVIVGLLENELNLAIRLIKSFIDVDDGYVKEGLYCAIYGAVLRTNNLSSAEELGQTIYEDIFAKVEVYPHVIVRAHAKAIIDYITCKNIDIKRDLNKIKPPYSSKWYDEIPTDEEILAYEVNYEDENVTRKMYCINDIIHSMSTNTGKKPLWYGDFGRYTFEGWVKPWKYYYIAQELSNIVVKIIMEQYGYDCEKHGEFDVQITRHDRYNHFCERIGKKYQRIASFEMLARLSDNFEPGEVKNVYSQAYIANSRKKLKSFFPEMSKDMLEDELSKEGEVDNEEGEDDVQTIFVPYKYEGPWQFRYRGIDPTVLAEPAEEEKNFWEDIWCIPDLPSGKWAIEDAPEPNLNNILFVNYDNEEFVVLEMYNIWKNNEKLLTEEPNEYFVKALAMFIPEDYVIKLNEDNGIKEFAEGRDYNETYTIFGREFYQSEAYKYYEKQCLEDEEEDETLISMGLVYHCPASYSEQVENVISSYTIPCKYLIDELQLEQLEDAKWYNKNGELVAVSIIVDGYQDALLFKERALTQIMMKKKMKIVWGIYTEKNENNMRYSTRKVAQWSGDRLNVEQYEKERWG